MSITIFKNTPATALPDTVPVGLPLSDQVSQISGHNVERDDRVQTGIWECTPGRWRRQVEQQEFCHFIQGHCTFKPDGGEPIEIRAGDALLMPAHTKGVWEVYETVRKTYVLIDR